MMSIPKYLTKIVESKQAEVAKLIESNPEAEFRGRISSLSGTIRPFSAALRSKPFNLIAEVKKASPSKGIIREAFDPIGIAKGFEQAGATALSVLTDAPFFMGDLSYISSIKSQVKLPILRKDFILDSIQILESGAAGADAILLIMSILTLDQATNLHQFARALGLSVLVEVHNSSELESALAIPGLELLGINNRNLDTFEVDLNTSFSLISKLSPELVWVSESGFDSNFQLEMARQSGFQAVLIGEGLARNPELIDFFK